MKDPQLLVEHLATLAKLPLSSEKLSQTASQLDSIMEYMEQIKSLPVSDEEGTSRVSDEENVLRDDLVQTSFSQDEALANASTKHEGFFMVDAVIEKDE